MNEPHLTTPLLPHQRSAARRWLLLAVMAMALSALLAILLVLSRTPGVQELFGLKAAFHTVLVLHVNFAVLLWLLSFGGALWSLSLRHHAPLRDTLAYGLALGGALLLLASPWLNGATPVMSNYIPVLDTPLFFAGLISFAAGVSLLAAGVVIQRYTGYSDARAGKRPALFLAAIAWFVALTVFLYHASQFMERGERVYEQIFWGGGHLLQFVYLLLLFAVWQQRGVSHKLSSSQVTLWLLGTALLIGITFDPGSEVSRSAFTHLMQIGTPLLLLPALWVMVRHQARHRDVSLAASLGLMVLGLAIGVLISSDTVTVTAHYHATNAAITVAFMGAAYGLLPRLGFSAPALRTQQWQMRLYTSGMALYVVGMASSGWLGVPRKSAVVIENGGAQLSMAVMGLGGIISVMATLLFVGVMFSAMMRRSAMVLNKPMGEMS